MKRILAVLVFLLAILAWIERDPLRSVWSYVTRGGHGCTLQRAWSLAAHEAALVASKDRILNASRLLRKDEKGLQLWSTPYGEFWTPAGSDFILPFNLAEQETHIYGTGELAVRSGDVVLDCGANVGVYTRECLNAGARLVVAIEPAPDNVECLRRTFAREVAEHRVIVYPKGVWDAEDTLEFRVDPKNQAADSFVINREGSYVVARIPVTTIDKLAAELGLDRVDYIKMDIEGAEVRALNGGRQTLARFHPRMALSAYHQADHPVEIPKAARAAYPGYRTTCGPCSLLPEGDLRPDVLFFY